MRVPRSLFLSLLALIILAGCARAPTLPPSRAAGDTPVPVPATPTHRPYPTNTPFPTISTGALQAGQQGYSHTTSLGIEVRYLLYVPESFDAGKQWPLVVFLHGSGERGGTPELLKQEYLPKMLEVKKDMPFLVVSPVLPSGQWENYLGPVDELVTHLVETLPVDPNRLYLTGLSLGGFGTWAYALQYPERFAAIAPIAGGYIHGSKEVPADACKLKDVAVWVFHGESDDGVKPFQAQVMVDALKPCGGEVKLDLYPNTGHSGAWFNAYEDSALWGWFLQHSR